MPSLVASLLETRWFVLFAWALLTFVFWTGGLAGIFDFASRAAEIRQAGLHPAELVTIVELGGTALIVTNRCSWLGAGALGVFLALTIPVGHAFWTTPEPRATASLFIVLEHISVIGGLIIAASLDCKIPGKTAKPA